MPVRHFLDSATAASPAPHVAPLAQALREVREMLHHAVRKKDLRADLSGWRDAFLEAGAASLKSRPRDDRDARIAQLQAKLGEATMDCELLQEKIDRMEGRRPLARRRSKP